ncbi:hypothetical protein Baya_6731 [Bagarius yarrelli]|uniref:Uncharacterized protein n=1 Tax=Bagarius yarrelli TaxID=175774 RepID=A0A556TYP7_BAGYA|nr:hypothetical protein Baya_6731 [Bagarius yarrelli]
MACRNETQMRRHKSGLRELVVTLCFPAPNLIVPAHFAPAARIRNKARLCWPSTTSHIVQERSHELESLHFPSPLVWPFRCVSSRASVSSEFPQRHLTQRHDQKQC